MEENYWDWFEKQELEEHNTVPVDDIFRDNPKPVPIDSGVEGLVRTVRASSILTLGCCSGLLSDHYDISAIKAESTYTEFVKNIGISQGNGLPNKRPSLATAAFLHEENDDARSQ